MDTQRLILLVIFSFSLLMLWEAWEKEKRQAATHGAGGAAGRTRAGLKPAPPACQTLGCCPRRREAKGEVIRVSTDLVVGIDRHARRTLKRVELVRHKDSKDLSKNLVYWAPRRQYEAQSGLAGEADLTIARCGAEPGERALAPGRDEVAVQLLAAGRARSAQELHLQAEQLRRRRGAGVPIPVPRRRPPTRTSSSRTTASRKRTRLRSPTFGAQSFIGFAVYTDERKFEKIHLSDLDKGKADYVKQATNGWLVRAAYFVSAWLPRKPGATTQRKAPRRLRRRAMVPVSVAPGGSAAVNVPLYVGRRSSAACKRPHRGSTS